MPDLSVEREPWPRVPRGKEAQGEASRDGVRGAKVNSGKGRQDRDVGKEKKHFPFAAAFSRRWGVMKNIDVPRTQQTFIFERKGYSEAVLPEASSAACPPHVPRSI